MQLETKKYLFDILSAIEEMENYFEEIPKDFLLFSKIICSKELLSEIWKS